MSQMNPPGLLSELQLCSTLKSFIATRLQGPSCHLSRQLLRPNISCLAPFHGLITFCCLPVRKTQGGQSPGSQPWLHIETSYTDRTCMYQPLCGSSLDPTTGPGHFVLFGLCLCFDLVIFLDDSKFLLQLRTMIFGKQSQTLILVTLVHLEMC